MTRSRSLVVLLGLLVLLAMPLVGEAQTAGKVWRVGYLSAGPSNDPYRDAFRQGLRDLGYVEGENIVVEYRYGEGDFRRMPILAAELAALGLSAIVAGGTPPLLALKDATKVIPIIMVTIQDPVSIGVSTNLARPEGNVTGLTCFAPELRGKRLELLKETVSGLTRAAVLVTAANPPQELFSAEAAARSLGLRLEVVNVRSRGELSAAFSSMTRKRAEALMVMPDPLLFGARREIAELARARRLPTVYDFREAVDSGGLMSYGPSLGQLFRRAPAFVDRILKGAKPESLPIERPTTFELVINMKTAKALGLAIPRSILLRADQVIE